VFSFSGTLFTFHVFFFFHLEKFIVSECITIEPHHCAFGFPDFVIKNFILCKKIIYELWNLKKNLNYTIYKYFYENILLDNVIRDYVIGK